MGMGWLWAALLLTIIPKGECVSALALGETMPNNEISIVYSN
jgi:hypothetical protein